MVWLLSTISLNLFRGRASPTAYCQIWCVWDASLLRVCREFPHTPQGMAQAVLEGWGNPKAVDHSHSNAISPSFPVFGIFLLFVWGFFYFNFWIWHQVLSLGARALSQAPLSKGHLSSVWCTGISKKSPTLRREQPGEETASLLAARGQGAVTAHLHCKARAAVGSAFTLLIQPPPKSEPVLLNHHVYQSWPQPKRHSTLPHAPANVVLGKRNPQNKSGKSPPISYWCESLLESRLKDWQ